MDDTSQTFLKYKYMNMSKQQNAKNEQKTRRENRSLISGDEEYTTSL